jgi:hypothetical protein
MASGAKRAQRVLTGATRPAESAHLCHDHLAGESASLLALQRSAERPSEARVLRRVRWAVTVHSPGWSP